MQIFRNPAFLAVCESLYLLEQLWVILYLTRTERVEFLSSGWNRWKKRTKSKQYYDFLCKRFLHLDLDEKEWEEKVHIAQREGVTASRAKFSSLYHERINVYFKK